MTIVEVVVAQWCDSLTVHISWADRAQSKVGPTT